MTSRTAAVFCMPEQGHCKRLLGFARAGVATHVFTDLRFRGEVERAGERERMQQRLSEARSWELAALHGRDAVIERIDGLLARTAK